MQSFSGASQREKSANCGAWLHNLHFHPSFRYRGQELAEFAIVIPILVLVAFGVLDLGRAFHALITINNAAREGARFGISYGLDSDYNPSVYAIQVAAQNEAVSSGINIPLGNISVTCPDLEGCQPGHPLEVSVSYNFDLVNAFILGSPITMERSVRMMVP